MLRAIVRLHAASRPFPIFSAAAPLAPADPMLPGLFFCLPPPPRGPRTDCGPRKRYISATAGMGRSGCSTLRGPQGIVSTTKGDRVMEVAEFLMVDPKVLILIGAFLVALAAFGVSNRIGR
jgi:hypothetical protein